MRMDEFEQRLCEADLVILHAGAGSVIHAIRSGKVPVIMPRRACLGEHIDDHQVEFCRELERTGKVLVASNLETLLTACNTALTRQQLTQKNDITEPPLVDLVRVILKGNTL